MAMESRRITTKASMSDWSHLGGWQWKLALIVHFSCLYASLFRLTGSGNGSNQISIFHTPFDVWSEKHLPMQFQNPYYLEKGVLIFFLGSFGVFAFFYVIVVAAMDPTITTF